MNTILKNSLRLALCLTAAAGLSCNLGAQIRLPVVIGDNMVLQQGKEVAIWGEGTPGRKISVKFGGQTVRTEVAQDSSWILRLAPMESSFEPRSMVISDGKTSLTLQNILVGEVWLASGQSNMEYRMDRKSNYLPPERGEDVQKRLFELGGDPRINVLFVERVIGVDTLPSDGWKSSDRESIAEVSAPAYFFALNLADSLNVPVGIISSSWGGSQIELWTASEVISSYVGSDPYIAPCFGIAPALYGSKFHSMIEPLIPYTLKGFLWYQGESNLLGNPVSFITYLDKQCLLMDSWRKLWGEEDLPFYHVQLAPYDYSRRKDPYPVSRDLLPRFWLMQQLLADLPHGGMALTIDLVDDTGDIHPPYKDEVGRRLALLALRNDYGRTDLTAKGPEFRCIEMLDGEIAVSFYNAAGLHTPDGKAPEGFELLTRTGRMLRPECRIDGEKVILVVPEGVEVGEVRFCWDESATTNLYNGAGLPAYPFIEYTGTAVWGSQDPELQDLWSR